MLKGRNRHEEHLDVAKSVVRRIAREPAVEGIVLLGGLTRGFADEYSDVDIVVIIQRRDARLKRRLEAIGRSAGVDASVEMDMEVHSIRDFTKLERTDWRRWEYGLAETVFDRRGVVGRVISQLVTVPEDYWVDRIVESWTYLQWYGCPAEGSKSIAEIWVERDDPVSAHCCLNYSMDLLMDLLFALNREFVPPPKWRSFCMRSLRWKPRGLRKVFEQVCIVKSLDGADIRRRVGHLRSLHRSLDRKALAATEMSAEQFVCHFLKKAVFETV